MWMLAVRQGYAVYAVRKQGVSDDDGSFCISRLGRVRVALRGRSTTQPPRSDPQGCHEPKNDPIGTPHALGKSPLCDGLREVWNIIVIIRPHAATC